MMASAAWAAFARVSGTARVPTTGSIHDPSATGSSLPIGRVRSPGVPVHGSRVTSVQTAVEARPRRKQATPHNGRRSWAEAASSRGRLSSDEFRNRFQAEPAPRFRQGDTGWTHARRPRSPSLTWQGRADYDLGRYERGSSTVGRWKKPSAVHRWLNPRLGDHPPVTLPCRPMLS
jgi:hypothetical protein